MVVENVDKVFITAVEKGVDCNHLLMYSSQRNKRTPRSRSGQAIKLGALSHLLLAPSCCQILLQAIIRIRMVRRGYTIRGHLLSQCKKADT